MDLLAGQRLSLPSDEASSLGDIKAASSLKQNNIEWTPPILVRCIVSLLVNESTHKFAMRLVGLARVASSAVQALDVDDRYLVLDDGSLGHTKHQRFIGFSQLSGFNRSECEYETLALQQPRSTMNDTQMGDAHLSEAIEDDSLDLLKLHEHITAFEDERKLEVLNENWQLILCIVYSITAFASIFLNSITMIVLSRCRRSLLGKYLINLSMSDLIMSCISIPITYNEYMIGHWYYKQFLCPLSRVLVTMCVFVSGATMTVIGLNRHLAIVYPLKNSSVSKLRSWTMRRKRVLLFVWALGIGISLPESLLTSTIPFCYNGQLYYQCGQSHRWPIMEKSYTVLIFLSTFLIPFVSISYMYIRAAMELGRARTPGHPNLKRDETLQMRRAKVIKMLFVVVVVFLIAWLPLQTFSFVAFMNPESLGVIVGNENLFAAIFFVCHWMGMAHSCANPLIYCFMNNRFRTDLRNLICCGLQVVRSMSSRRSFFCESHSTIQRNRVNNQPSRLGRGGYGSESESGSGSGSGSGGGGEGGGESEDESEEGAARDSCDQDGACVGGCGVRVGAGGVSGGETNEMGASTAVVPMRGGGSGSVADGVGQSGRQGPLLNKRLKSLMREATRGDVSGQSSAAANASSEHGNDAIEGRIEFELIARPTRGELKSTTSKCTLRATRSTHKLNGALKDEDEDEDEDNDEGNGDDDDKQKMDASEDPSLIGKGSSQCGDQFVAVARISSANDSPHKATGRQSMARASTCELALQPAPIVAHKDLPVDQEIYELDELEEDTNLDVELAARRSRAHLKASPSRTPINHMIGTRGDTSKRSILVAPFKRWRRPLATPAPESSAQIANV